MAIAFFNISFSSLILAISFFKALTSFNVITSFSSTLISFTSLTQPLIVDFAMPYSLLSSAKLAPDLNNFTSLIQPLIVDFAMPYS